jgi:opacity protein-like surface antigen
LITFSKVIPNGVDADRVQDAYGVSVGINFNRYVGVELAGDMYEPAINFTGDNAAGISRTISEYKVWTLVPQVRLRYPLLDGRLTPYILGGVGVSLSQLNDRKFSAFGLPLAGSNTARAATLGAGLEYFLLTNLATGLEAKYVDAGAHPLQVGPLAGTAHPSALVTTASVRLLWPEATTADRPAAPTAPPEPDQIRGYVQARFGGAFFPHQGLIGTIQAAPAQIGYGLSLGVDLTRYVSVEVAADTTEADVRVAGQGKVGEYALWSAIPQLRVRYARPGSRLVPYVVGGVGILWTEFNDRTARVHRVAIAAQGRAVVGSLGAGIEACIASNLALGLDVKYLLAGGQPFTIQGQVSGTVHPHPLYTALGLRILFP